MASITAHPDGRHHWAAAGPPVAMLTLDANELEAVRHALSLRGFTVVKAAEKAPGLASTSLLAAGARAHRVLAAWRDRS